MTILCEPNHTVAAAVAPQLDDAAGVRIVDNLTDAAAWVGYSADERLVVIGAAVPFIDVVAFADYMHTIYPDAMLVLLRDTPDDDIVLESLAAGVVEVVPAGDRAALAAACGRVRDVLATRAAAKAERPADAEPAPPAHEEAPLGEVVTVFSAKGGTGKTIVSTNLALALNAQGNRRVCLVDLDLEFGDVAICLQLAPTRSIVDAVTLGRAIDEESIAELITPYAPRLDCVLAPVNPGDSELVTAAVVREVISQLRERYDYVVIDTPSQFSEQVLEAFDAADQHVLVTTPEIPSLKNLRLTLDMLDMLDYGKDSRHVVLNRADPKTGLSLDEAEAAIRSSITVQLPATQEAPASINRGVPLVAGEPQHAFSAAMRRFADGSIAPTPVVTVERRRRRLGLTLRKRSA